MTKKAETSALLAIEIDIVRQSGDWPPVESVIEAALKESFRHLNLRGESEVSVVLADDAFIRNLNREYRDKDKPTNVLSFPQLDIRHPDIPLPGPLGDIVFGLETIRREADEAGKSFNDHISHLAVHGLLHLLGYDHEDETGAEEMESIEIQILKSLGIKNPYEV